ncbi:hypothetical protein ABIA39_005386 [Nocardia sp. GAS34]|uniref:hypothetical protein n=1 Tax=unclassified Nocardia TaxID=2637762 RepID=UPI003D1FB1BC
MQQIVGGDRCTDVEAEGGQLARQVGWSLRSHRRCRVHLILGLRGAVPDDPVRAARHAIEARLDGRHAEARMAELRRRIEEIDRRGGPHR